jgi:hypothetical protein
VVEYFVRLLRIMEERKRSRKTVAFRDVDEFLLKNIEKSGDKGKKVHNSIAKLKKM